MRASRRENWPQHRADLEQKLETAIRQFVAAGSFDPDVIRALAKNMASIERVLEHLDAAENKAAAISSRKIGRIA